MKSYPIDIICSNMLISHLERLLRLAPVVRHLFSKNAYLNIAVNLLMAEFDDICSKHRKGGNFYKKEKKE